MLRFAVAAVTLAGSLLVVATVLASLSPGGSFDDVSALDGWAFPPFDAGELAFDLRDADAESTSGSMRVTNASSLRQVTTVRAGRCLGPALPGARYHVAADLLLPRAQLVNGEVQLVLDWYTSVECIGVSAVRMELEETSREEAASEWVHVSATRFAPPGVRSVGIRVEVTKRGDMAADPTRPLDALVDNLYVVPFSFRLHAPVLVRD